MAPELSAAVSEPSVRIEQSLLGQVLRRHTATGFEDVGRFVHIGSTERAAWLIPFPSFRKDRPGSRVTKINSPEKFDEETLSEFLATKKYSVVPFVKPGGWNFVPQDLEDLSKPMLAGRAGRHQKLGKMTVRRKHLEKWLAKLRKLESLVAPIFKLYQPADLLEFGMLAKAIDDESKASGVGGPRLRQLVLLKLRGCGHPCALLPDWSKSGAPGQERIGKKKVGPKTSHTRPCSADDRYKLQYGFTKYKCGKSISEEEAYLLTCAEFWPGDTEVVSKEDSKKPAKLRVVYSLAEPGSRPTLRQFRWAAARAKLSSTVANLGKRLADRCRAKSGRATDGVVAVGQLALIDSTSEDQTLVSDDSRLTVLSTTWRAMVCDVKTTYILGIYSGFEHSSTLTNLLAILNSADSKVEYCARYGRKITEDQWLGRLPKRIRADNGEMKSEKGISTMSRSEVSLEFVRSWTPELKGPIESLHNVTHRGTDHKNAGSTGGKQRQRGDASREAAACRKHRENVGELIDFILFHNNIEMVPHLLTREMYEDGVKPTRREIYLWCEANGYVSSEPTDLDSLRTMCLPRLAASFASDGLHLFDPRYTEAAGRRIPNLVYVGSLHDRLWKGKTIGCEAYLDPNDLSRCFVRHADELGNVQLFELRRKTSDMLANELTLKNHIDMWDHIAEIAAEGKPDEDNDRVRRLTSNRVTNEAAMVEKKAEARLKMESVPSETQARKGKRQNTMEERERQRLLRLGLEAKPNSETPVAAGDDESIDAAANSRFETLLALKKMMEIAEDGQS